MQLDTFMSKSQEMGDFYVYFTDPVLKTDKFAVATTDLSTKYIATSSRKKPKLLAGEVLMWNWLSNNYLKLPIFSIKKLVPLASVLKNDSTD